MKTLKTTEDGWDCIPELKQAINYLDDARTEVYEIKNCVRLTSLRRLVENLQINLQSALDCLEEIDVDLEIIQVDEDD